MSEVTWKRCVCTKYHCPNCGNQFLKTPLFKPTKTARSQLYSDLVDFLKEFQTEDDAKVIAQAKVLKKRCIAFIKEAEAGDINEL